MAWHGITIHASHVFAVKESTKNKKKRMETKLNKGLRKKERKLKIKIEENETGVEEINEVMTIIFM